MKQRTQLDTSTAWARLAQTRASELPTLLTGERIATHAVEAGGGLAYNWAAMPFEEEHLTLLQAFADELQLTQRYRSLVNGAIMNTGEQRMVLHHLCRGQLDQPVYGDGEDKGEFYRAELKKVRTFSDSIRRKELTGSTGKSITDVVQIGIGGSDLGPRALYLALQWWAKAEGVETLNAHFISNVDPDDAASVIASLDLERTLFILVSKSGTTLETLTNRDFVIKAMKARAIAGLDPAQHLVAVTSKSSPLAASSSVRASFFIDDYIGGRYSSTSAVGAVVLSLAFGYEVFAQLLDGAHDADKRAFEPKIVDNAALLDALFGVYFRNIEQWPTSAILPYSQALSRFPAHLQQLDMESNGKSVTQDKQEVSYPTGPIIFGEAGTNGQHSFYQLLHQGTDIVPLQFIGFKDSQLLSDIEIDGFTSQEKLNANLVAQIVAFARGKDDEDPNKRFEGGRPSSLLYGDRLTPKTLGALLAHYENKVMFQGFVWNLNSFDQEGVQLGKVLATKVLAGSEGDDVLKAFAALFGL
jgi:glucose-6-phosphate isomerase